MIESSQDDQFEHYSQYGVINLCKLFHKKQEIKQYIKQQQNLYELMNPLWKVPQIRQHQQELNELFNIWYVLERVRNDILLHGEMINNLADNKVIKVLINFKLLYMITNFKQQAIWRPQCMSKLIEQLIKVQEQLVLKLKYQIIFIQDLDGLYSLKTIFKSAQYKQTYAKIGQMVTNNTKIYNINQKLLEKLFNEFIGCLYQNIGTYIIELQQKDIHKRQQLDLQRIKLMLIVLKFNLKKYKDYGKVHGNSMLKKIRQFKAYLWFEQLFTNDSLQVIQEQKKLYKTYLQSVKDRQRQQIERSDESNSQPIGSNTMSDNSINDTNNNLSLSQFDQPSHQVSYNLKKQK